MRLAYVGGVLAEGESPNFGRTMTLLPLPDGSLPTVEIRSMACESWNAFLRLFDGFDDEDALPANVVLVGEVCNAAGDVVLWSGDGHKIVHDTVMVDNGDVVYMGLGSDQWVWPATESVFDVSLHTPRWIKAHVPDFAPLPLPLQMTPLAARPRLFHVAKLLSVQETWYLRMLGRRAGLAASGVLDGVDTDRRSSRTASLASAELGGDTFLLALRARAQSLLRLDDSVGFASVEALQVVRYEAGQKFGLHYDALVDDGAIKRAGLTFAAVTNTCAMGMLLAKLPYNRGASCDLRTVVAQLVDAK